ncbi:spore germination protein [Cohnella nanjingensis]|uniref:Spore germination protein n=1 Tax=Cohnella nanjingensis TaxID=1387779 RepID=A0A7X0VHR9_9BACL|nr:spore germination protein [Cohnella nanjingensis]MBB6672939.1 spore germination protein [Cohnella nanjingensis]
MKRNNRPLQEQIGQFKSELGNSADLSIRECAVGVKQIPIAVLWLDGIVDTQSLNEGVLAPLISRTRELDVTAHEDLYIWLQNSVITAKKVSHALSIDQAITLLLSGHSIVVMDGCEGSIAVETLGIETRSIEEPASTVVVRGPRDGFVESLEVNVSLIRRRIQNKKLRVEAMTVGSVTHTSILILYLQDRAPEETVAEVRRRLSQIHIDAVLESHYIEEIIRDNARSLFPTVYSTERPDDIAGGIVEGRVALMVNGTPFVLLVPCTLFHLMKTSEDYYLAYPVATFVRWLRYIGLFIALLFPSLYVGVLMFHPEMVPPYLLSSILSAREGVPFPLLIEALLMELTFEGLREAGIRMPRAVGSAISIVGALVIGESAVRAGIISSPTVIIVAGTAISSFIIPSIDLSGTIRLLRFFMLICASLFGLYGVLFGLILIGIHLTTLRSFGISYLAPIAPYKKDEARKTLIRVPWWTLRTHSRRHR